MAKKQHDIFYSPLFYSILSVFPDISNIISNIYQTIKESHVYSFKVYDFNVKPPPGLDNTATTLAYNSI